MGDDDVNPRLGLKESCLSENGAEHDPNCCCLGMFRGIKQYFRFNIEAKAAARSIPFFPEDRTTHEIGGISEVSSPPRHQLWSAILQRHVRRGSIRGIPTNTLDYVGLAADPEFPQYLQQLSSEDLQTLTPDQQLATWINAYNALCAGLIVDFYQSQGSLPRSITNLSNSPKGPCWDQPAGTVGGKLYTLAEIEHQVVRQQWRSPQVHACLVCASTSCPDLRMEAYEAEGLKLQMEDQLRVWLANPLKGADMMDRDELVLSRIFLWYYKDFGVDRFDVIEYIKCYVAGNPRLTVSHHTPSRLSYFTYDWGLNHAGAKEGAAGEASEQHTPRL